MNSSPFPSHPKDVPQLGGGRPQPGHAHANTFNRNAMCHPAQPLDPSRARTVSPKSNTNIPTPSSPSSHESNGLAKYDPSTPQIGSPNDRNQLNLAKISDGGDTRTTIMIKNIPNKMSDLDLTAYIGQVCPRKIDFLYLRMDFKNGKNVSDGSAPLPNNMLRHLACNVGYAFVNFINVQDLLLFVRKRLGVKWSVFISFGYAACSRHLQIRNMFKSDKVLQMSYANYQ
jgi:hypothetical protein